MKYTLGQLESLLESLNKNHDSPTESNKMVDGDAIRFLMKNGGGL